MINKNDPQQCPVCDMDMIYVDHYEYDGVTEHGSHEPYWECPDNCVEPDEPTSPKTNIDKEIDSLIDKVVLEFNPQTLDDDIPDLLQDWDEREEAIDYLVEKLTKLKAE